MRNIEICKLCDIEAQFKFENCYQHGIRVPKNESKHLIGTCDQSKEGVVTDSIISVIAITMELASRKMKKRFLVVHEIYQNENNFG